MNTVYDITVIVCTYNSSVKKTLQTLKSIIFQKNINFEIIISDDGSKVNNKKEVEKYLSDKDITYSFIANEINQGTVLNLYGAVLKAQGKYIKPISPGDYLYSENTLKIIYDFMEINELKAAFGGAIYYSYENNKLKVYNVKDPVLDEIYREGIEYSYESVKKAQLLYGDFILGACMVFEKNTSLKGLEFIKNKVIYTEDVIMQYLAVLDYKILKIPQNIIWYEYGSGISGNNSLGYSTKIYNDNYEFRKILREQFPNSNIIKKSFFEYDVGKNKTIKKKFIRELSRIFDFERRAFKRRYKNVKKRFLCQYDEQYFWRWYEIGE